MDSATSEIKITGTVRQCAVWKVLYEQLADHVDQLHAAFARLVALNGFSPEGAAQEVADMALFMDQFLASQPFDLIARLQARQTAA